KFTLPRSPARLTDPACSISSFIFLIAQDRRLPARYHYRFSSFSENFMVFVPGSFPDNIDAWRSPTLLSHSEGGIRRAHRRGQCGAPVVAPALNSLIAKTAFNL